MVGKVGCGKSSLLASFLNELHKISGEIAVNGSISYASQLAWIQNETIKENILFGKSYDAHNYINVVHACALVDDLNKLAAGGDTEIGENGINLSGGQRQRISLARTVYNNADIYLFDDPLSAVDTKVAKVIFNDVIGPMGILSEKVINHSIALNLNFFSLICHFFGDIWLNSLSNKKNT